MAVRTSAEVHCSTETLPLWVAMATRPSEPLQDTEPEWEPMTTLVPRGQSRVTELVGSACTTPEPSMVALPDCNVTEATSATRILTDPLFTLTSIVVVAGGPQSLMSAP